MYSHEKNISRVFELYEKLFSLKQDGRLVSDYFASLKGTADEILLYHPLSCDAQTRKTQWEDFLVAKFLSGLDNNLRVVRDHLLASDSVPTLSNALSRVLRVATGSSESFSSSGTTTESSAMTVCDRGRSSSRGRGSTNSTTSCYCTIVVEPIMSLKNVGSNMVYQNGLILLTVEVSLHWNLLPPSQKLLP
ncbi:UNVERIFIED_CONTAM: hypothetical protein Slati_0817300 [Sesamum latifolium]|uniref:Uncharacterized protein n=1 Tax=Sesamum latifolium TaxID=2727402 RepID=A0AAW2XR79_9LAMI